MFAVHDVGGCTVNVVSRVVAAIALGSNLDSRWGDRDATLREAIGRVGGLGEVLSVSSFYETTPVGYLEQPNFLNGAMLLRTSLEAPELMAGLLGVEAALGRVRTVVNGPRVIDLDLLLFGDGVIEQAGLVVPHPRLAERRFVLEPLCEIAPDMVDPRRKTTIREMLASLDRSWF